MTYLKVGNKVVEISGYNEAGVPVIKATAEKIMHSDGRVDVVIKVPCLQMNAKKEE